MQATLYKMSNDTVKLNKTLTSALNVDIVIKEDNCDILNPVIELAYFDSYIDYNYIYIPNFKRYYFISNPILLLSGFVRLICKVDVLYSWNEQISNCDIIIDRSSVSSRMIADGNIKNYVTKQIMNRLFTNSEILTVINEPNYSITLAVIGGVGSV